MFLILCVYIIILKCKYLIDRKSLLYNFDVCGWLIEYFVVMVGNEDIFNDLDVKKFKKINWGKIVLYICCEYGCDDFYEKIFVKVLYMMKMLKDGMYCIMLLREGICIYIWN